YDQQYSSLITVPDNPIQIADAALYLSVKNPGLKITDPYELTQKQFDAVVNLLKTQKPLVKKYWPDIATEETLFKSGDVVLGAAFHANAPETYFNSIKSWKTPITTCDDGTDNCMPYDQWQSAWTTIKG